MDRDRRMTPLPQLPWLLPRTVIPLPLGTVGAVEVEGRRESMKEEPVRIMAVTRSRMIVRRAGRTLDTFPMVCLPHTLETNQH
jgi:hypothetical protein